VISSRDLYAARPDLRKTPRRAGGQARIGGATEARVLALADPKILILQRIENGMKRVGGGKSFAVKQAVDYFGTFVGGRSLVFDAKHSRDASFDFSNEKVMKRHQIEAIIRHGQAGAVAGVLVDSMRVGWLWFSWRELTEPLGREQFHSGRWMNLVINKIDWKRLELT
jgi:hypothetical protein